MQYVIKYSTMSVLGYYLVQCLVIGFPLEKFIGALVIQSSGNFGTKGVNNFPF